MQVLVRDPYPAERPAGGLTLCPTAAGWLLSYPSWMVPETAEYLGLRALEEECQK